MERLTAGPQDYQALAEIASRLELFANMKGAQLDHLLSRLQLYSFSRGEVIFHRGDPPLAFYIIYQGEVIVRLESRWFGLIQRVARLGPGNLLGEMALLESRPRSATAVAHRPARLFVMFREEFEALVQSNPSFAEGVRWLSEQRKFEAGH